MVFKLTKVGQVIDLNLWEQRLRGYLRTFMGQRHDMFLIPRPLGKGLPENGGRSLENPVIFRRIPPDRPILQIF